MSIQISFLESAVGWRVGGVRVIINESPVDRQKGAVLNFKRITNDCFKPTIKERYYQEK